ncbi:hypothetical protein M3Y97_00713800 [Aphelenchoides bicaudatus]|nr:hypothetical protein M3Y97_00713800 [Aphelenchoides bicaudatus]
MMKKWRRRLQRFLGSSSDLSELSKSSNNGVHLISASNVHSRLPPTHLHHPSQYSSHTDLNRNPSKDMHFNELNRTHGDYMNGVGYHPNGNMAKSVPNGLHSKQRMHLSTNTLSYNTDAAQFAYRNHQLNNFPQSHHNQYYNGNRYPSRSSSRPSSVYSLYNSNMQIPEEQTLSSDQPPYQYTNNQKPAIQMRYKRNSKAPRVNSWHSSRFFGNQNNCKFITFINF